MRLERPMPEILEGSLVVDRGVRFAVVASRFNDVVTSRLIEGAMGAFTRHGVAEKDVRIVRVPGSFEIPVTARRLAAGGQFGAVVCLGALIRGETPHFDHVAGECARGLQDVALGTGIGAGLILGGRLQRGTLLRGAVGRANCAPIFRRGSTSG